jgi:hypothetical protein
MVHYVVRHYPEYEFMRWPRRWTDLHCDQLIKHMQCLERHGITVHWCCGLDIARDKRDYSIARHWIFTHKYVVRKLLCYEVEYGE